MYIHTHMHTYMYLCVCYFILIFLTFIDSLSCILILMYYQNYFFHILHIYNLIFVSNSITDFLYIFYIDNLTHN